MAATATATPRATATVRISRRLADAIKAQYFPDRLEPAEKFGPVLDPWIYKLLKKAKRSLSRDRIADSVRAEAQEKRDAIVRLRRSQVGVLGVISSITGRSVSDMVEEKLWEILEAQT